MTHKPLLLVVSVLALTAARTDDEAEAKGAFVALQSALKAVDADKIWPLLDTTTQKAIEKSATALAAEYDKGTAAGKTQLEKLFGLNAEEMAKLKTTPQLYTKTKRFLKQWHEVPGSKITQVSIDGNKATLKYTEDDGDKEEMQMSKQDGKWKVVLSKAP